MGGNKRKFSSTRRKKRYFTGNRFTGKKTMYLLMREIKLRERHKGTRSETKLAGKTPEVPESVYNQLLGNRIMDMDLFLSCYPALHATNKCWS